MGVTLKAARRDLGYALKSLEIKTTGVEATPDSGVYSGIASGLYATRRVVSSQLANLGLSGQDTRRDWYNDKWALICTSPPAQRMVSSESYVGNSTVADALTGTVASATLPVGYVLLDRDLAIAIPSGTEVEFHTVLPPDRPEAGLKSLKQCLNDALNAIVTIRTIDLVGNSGYVYDLSAYNLTRQSQLKEVLGTQSVPGLEAGLLQGGGYLEWDGNVPNLKVRTQLSSSDQFSIKVEVPAGRWVSTNNGVTWAYSAVGFVNETDQVDVDPEVLTRVAHYHAALSLSRPGLDGANSTWLAEARRAADLALPHMKYGQRVMTPVPSGPIGPFSRVTGRRGRRWSR